MSDPSFGKILPFISLIIKQKLHAYLTIGVFISNEGDGIAWLIFYFETYPQVNN